MLEKLLGRMKEIYMTINTERIVSRVVSTLEAKTYSNFSIFLTRKQTLMHGTMLNCLKLYRKALTLTTTKKGAIRNMV